MNRAINWINHHISSTTMIAMLELPHTLLLLSLAYNPSSHSFSLLTLSHFYSYHIIDGAFSWVGRGLERSLNHRRFPSNPQHERNPQVVALSKLNYGDRWEPTLSWSKYKLENKLTKDHDRLLIGLSTSQMPCYPKWVSKASWAQWTCGPSNTNGILITTGQIVTKTQCIC